MQPGAQIAVEGELQSYLYKPAIELDENPLDWWNANQLKYPTFSTLMKYRSIPATSATSERSYSAAGLV